VAFFTAFGAFSVKTVAVERRHSAYQNKHWWQAFYGVNIDDLEWPWTPKI